MHRRQAVRLLALGGASALLTVQAQEGGVVRTVVLSGEEVAPTPTPSRALAVVRLELLGRRLRLLGVVAGLEGPFRDYTQDPVDDPALNARLFSAFHLHRGPRGQNSPLVTALRVEPSSDGRAGVVRDEVELSLEDLLRLRRGELYLDVHTRAHRAGEVRGQIAFEKG
ncbi:CHRD domain-containing protein (plasmid) [Thermus oshimai JL-2]|uniref:CHRD domain-containing protein n=1 Tax=Thermus oshimai JL-2 TaxID=751945 RepID=K7QWW1_THEOS|nr:CHRD domain-containing protein [Thermus oshimai]AFV77361.1 CHRD domain-containing protein [Thermus oshimai JL-2]